ncbi:nitrogen regulation protein NR(II) [Planctomycetota bacterium]
MTENSSDHPAGLTPADLEIMLQQFNDTTASLQNSHQRLQGQVAELTRELEQKNLELQRKRRLEALGQMAAGVAHEIRNPLGGIQLYASMLEKDLDEQPDQLRLIQKILGGVQHLNSIVEDLLAFTNTIIPAFAATDVHRVLEEAISFVSAGFELSFINICRNYDTDLLPVPMDPNLMRRAFLNILLNAEQAMRKNGTLIIDTMRDGDGVGIVFTDSGSGIPEEFLEKIFNPFFTKKEKGTGLGLAIVYRIIESHKGDINADNSPEGGAVFTIKLPGRQSP